MRLGGRRYKQMIKNVIPCKHKYGADLTWSAHTDTYRPTVDGHGVDFEINAFKHNLKGTILLNHQTDSTVECEIKGALETGVLGAGAYFRAAEELQPQVDWLERVIGRKPAYWSYAYGTRDHDDFVLANGLVSRLSSVSKVDYDFSDRLGHAVSSLFNYNVRDIDMTTALTNARNALQNTINTGGWYNDFSHWHWAEFYGDKNQIDQWLTDQKALLNGVNYVSLGASEAVEYMWLRKQFKRGGIYQDGDELVLVCDVINEEKIPYETIDTTLSINVDLTGTILEGKDITSATDIIKSSENQYIIQVPYSNYDGFRSIRLKQTTAPKYLTLEKPQIVTKGIEGTSLNVTTDVETKLVVFSVPKGQELHNAIIIQRSNTYAREHSINIRDFLESDIYIGIVNKSGKSVLGKV
ncbi:hypothetical protein [Macrococcoides canis]|uniref:hypothetical protein n=1 Tax=Macrococcoides canis TaxID=1855823 RepID=UPI0020B8D018|nr:hypothetical protein [Macrococcus canis]UTH10773.1 hypothetical protein KFV10_07575 [Macrococcus canis]